MLVLTSQEELPMNHRNLTLALILLTLLSGFLGAQSPSETYKIGDTGPAGGIVFYDKGFISDGWQYLEAAPASAEFSAEWGLYDYDAEYDWDETNPTVGGGRANTRHIVELLNARGESNRAAQGCAALNINGYADWFLPSTDELDLMYTTIRKHPHGGFKTEEDFLNFTHGYWSSSQSSADSVWHQFFNNGYRYYGNRKNYTYSVRAVRAF